jgi:hypothetical protein
LEEVIGRIAISPAAHSREGNTQIVSALDEKSIGIDEFVSMRIWVLQRVPSVRISMGKDSGRRIKGVSSGFGKT